VYIVYTYCVYTDVGRRGDACQGVTCSYHGVCESLYNGDYKCVCHSGYFGSTCQYEGNFTAFIEHNS
jgi:hypothetical protein